MIVRWGYRRVPLSVRAVSHHSRYLGEERTVVLDLPWLSACPKTATAERMRSYKSLPSFTSGMSDCCQNFDVNWLFKTLLLRRQTCPVCLLNFSFWTFYLLSADWPQLQAWILSCSQQTGPAPLTPGQRWELKYSALQEETFLHLFQGAAQGPNVRVVFVARETKL